MSALYKTPLWLARRTSALAWLGSLGVVAGLGVAALWFAVFSVPTDTTDHSLDGLPMQMLMATDVTVLDGGGHPAAHAVAVLDGTQQVVTDAHGVAQFADVMLHHHSLTVTYAGQHYRLPLHIHMPDNALQLGMSDETRTLGALLCAGLLVLWLAVLAVAVVRTQRRLRRPRLVALAALVLGIGGGVCVLAGSGIQSVEAAHVVANDVSVPTQLSIEQDDTNAILTWNGGVLTPDKTEPPNVSGYLVTWGLSGQLVNTERTTDRIVQLQPLANGTAYQAYVQTVDVAGNLSPASATVSFTGSASRVNGLRSQMTGFFDDFDRSAGLPDELKWNTAYSACNDPAYNAFFVNTQSHVHTMIDDKYCDRGQTIVRPRTAFDFTKRTGTISFDFDGEFRRDQWYLDLVPQFVDITGQVSIEGGGSNNPGNVLRFHQNEQDIEILYIDANGNENSIAKTGADPYPSLSWRGLTLVPNVRRHWVIQVSQNAVQISINGVVVLQAALNLPFTKATLLWNEFSYNTHKGNEPYVLGHWDNFGFDGPATAVDTHNYRSAGYGGNDYAEIANSAATYQINLPDALTAEQSERLMYTLQMRTQQYAYTPSDRVVVNGSSFPMPKPQGVVPLEQLVTPINPYSQVINLPLGTLRTGINTVEFDCGGNCGLTNVHTEVDFPRGNAPAYTQPDKANAITVIPAMPSIAPGATIATINGQWDGIKGLSSQNQQAIPVSGSVALGLRATNELAMNGIGHNPGLARVELWLDKKPIWTQQTGGAPSFATSYTFDSTQYPNGRHELFFVAYNPAGQPSVPDYFEGSAVSGDYYPVFISITNAGGPSPTPTPTPLPPTPTPTPPPTPTPAPPSQPAVVALNSGGGAAGAFVPDGSYATGGNTFITNTPIDTNGVTNPAPQGVYDSERWGNFSYIIPNLTPNASYTVRLHFAEIYIYLQGVGQRIFNVSINGAPALTNFDIFASAGGPNKAIVREFAATANGAGQIVIQYTGVVDNAKSSGVEIIPATSAPPSGGGTLVSDSFNRADSDGLGNADSGQTWGLYGNGIQGLIRNHQATAISPSYFGTFAALDAGHADVTAHMTIAAYKGVTPMLVLRAKDSQNYLFVIAWQGRLYLQKYVAGQNITIASNAFTPADGDVYSATCAGSNYTIAVNGTTVITASDAFDATETKFGFSAPNANPRLSAFSVTGVSSTTRTAATIPVSHETLPTLGDSHIESQPHPLAAGAAEAYRFMATRTGKTGSIALYSDTRRVNSAALVGLYADNGTNAPGQLLAQGQIGDTKAGWNTISLAKQTAIVAGKRYWIAILVPAGAKETLTLRTAQALDGAAQGNAQSGLRALPQTWQTGPKLAGLLVSAYAIVP